VFQHVGQLVNESTGQAMLLQREWEQGVPVVCRIVPVKHVDREQ